MKYIRTKNGKLYDMNEVGIDENIKEQAYIHKSTLDVIYIKSIIKQADTIEELCDGDVLFENGQLKKVHYYKEGFGFNQYGNKLSDNQFVVLFIVTDKGLIYVAKINNKGELELL